ncbi:MAG: hypothetical protein AB4290_03890, partial [Spirulina sp.]
FRHSSKILIFFFFRQKIHSGNGVTNFYLFESAESKGDRACRIPQKYCILRENQKKSGRGAIANRNEIGRKSVSDREER